MRICQHNCVIHHDQKKRVTQLSKVYWFIKTDLKNACSQLPFHPSDWQTLIYLLGSNEFYIDIAMPFGEPYSSLVFCTWSPAWCESFKTRFQNEF